MNKKYEQFYQQIELQQGQAFLFSNPLQVQFKQPTQLKPNLFSTILTYVNYGKQYKNDMLQKLLIPVPNQFFLMAHGNAIRVYKHWQTEQQEIKCQILSQIQVNFNIKQVKFSPFSKFKNGKDFYFVVQDISSRYLAVLYYDVLQHQIKPGVVQRIQSKINCWSYIQNKQILIWCQNMKIYHYELKQNSLRQIQSVDTHIDIVNQQFTVKQIEKPKSRTKYKWNKQQEPAKKKQKKIFSLDYCCIIGQRQKEQDSTIVLFYVLYNQQLNAMKIKCKQILYPFENQSTQSLYNFLQPKNQFPYLKVQPQNYQIVSHNTANSQILKTLKIVKIQQAYLIKFQFQIIIIQKKFNQYFVVNNIYKKNKDFLVSMAYNSNVISCITDKILQLNRITITQNKISSQMIDFIDLELQYKRLSEIILKNFSANQNVIKIGAFDKYEGKLLELWISTDLYNQKHRKNIFFVFQVAYTQNKTMKKAYFFYVTQHCPRIKKITNLAHKASKPQDIIDIERLGKQLGISQSQFYYNMWKTSKKGANQITRYLLKCKDYKKILKQLRGFLRRKSFNATKLLKVLQRLQQLTLELLKQKLNEQNLVTYFHIVFLHRKFQVFQSNYIIDDQQFSQISQISLVQLVYKIINRVISPDVKNTSVWALQTKQPAKLYLIQVLNLFKFPLLQQYDLFLRSIFMNYPGRIPQVIDNFPQLLPNYPLQQIQIFAANTQSNQTTLPKSQSINQKQKQLFSSIKQQYLKNQKNFLQNTINQLYPIYSTSIILKIFQQAIGISQFKNKKYTFHTAIQSYYEEYKKNIKNVSKFDGKYLYIVVLNCLIKSNYLLRRQREQNIKNQYKIQLQLNSYSEIPSQYYQQTYEINDSQIDDLIGVYRKKYKIDQAVLQQLRIISYIYQLMINKQIIDAQQLNLQDIFAQPIQKWVALFFLGNKQQKDLIFNEFMAIFNKNKNKFQQFLNQYIISQHCSKIELSILVDLIDQNRQQFQKENQKIIQIIFDGYCARILVEDVRDADHFRQRISKIVLEKHLLKKADKISKINICYPILHNFYMQSTIVKDLLDNPIKFFRQIIDNFFSQNIRNNYIKLPQSYTPKYQLKIQQIKDMFNLIYFLRQNVFVEITGNQLVIAYCEILIQWQQFDQITYVLLHQQKIKSYKLNIQQIVTRVQQDVLDVLYALDGFCLTQQNKQYVNNILNISAALCKNQKQQKISKLVSQNRSKIQISDILTKWQQKQIPIFLINNLCEQWIKMYSEALNFQLKSYQNCVMYRIIQKYSIYMDLQSMKKIYEQFMNILKCNINYNDEHHQDYYRYCNFLCDRLIINNNFREAVKVVCVINYMFQFNYMLMAETMLLSIISIYLNVIPKNDDSSVKINEESCYMPKSESHKSLGKIFQSVQNNQKHTQKLAKKPFMLLQNQDASIYSQKYQPILPGIQITKLYINYFIAHWQYQDQQSLKLLYQTYFNIQQNQLQKYQQIVINSQLTYDHMNKNIDADILWNFVKTACEKHKLEQTDIVFGYFFMQMGLTIPELGFSQVDYISYIPSSLVTILYQFMIQCNNKNIYNFLDYSKIFTRYIDSLTRLLIIQHQSQIFNTNDQQYNNNKFNIYQLHKNANLHFVRQEILKNKEYFDDPLTVQINRMKIIMHQAFKNNNKRMLDFKIQHSTVSNFNLLSQNRSKRILGKTFRRQKSPQPIQKIPVNHQNQQDKMMSFEKFKSLKNKIKIAKKLEDLNVSERDVIQQIFNQTDQNRKQKEKQIMRLKQVVKNAKMQYRSKEKYHSQNYMKSLYEEQNNQIQKSGSQYILKGLIQ